jgi:predicted TIM-barrel fold metal-dependent hydrolase
MSPELPRFHDAHCHQPGDADGGLVIALECEPEFPGTLTNEQVVKLHDPGRRLIAVPYASAESVVEGPAIKYHPRFERYDPAWVSADIAGFSRRLVLIDSMNALRWEPRAYLQLAQVYPQTEFVMCHAGGYDIAEFVKMCRFLPNVWLDFSVTQHEFGWVSGERSPAFIGDVIDHAMREPRIAPRVMFGSDYPLLEQRDAVARLAATVDEPERFLRLNFERLLETVGDQLDPN